MTKTRSGEVLEMNQKVSRKERFLKWWSIEGKIECSAAAVVLVVLIVFWESLLVQGIVAIACAIWCLGKIYFRREQWAFLVLASMWVLSQGISALLAYMRS